MSDCDKRMLLEVRQLTCTKTTETWTTYQIEVKQ